MWFSTSTSTRSIAPTNPRSRLSAVVPGNRPLAHPEQGAVVPAQPDRRLAVAVEAQHDVLVQLADQDHLRDLDRLRVGHPQAVDELHLEAEPLHVLGDLGPAAVDDHRVHADVLEQHDVGRERLAQVLLRHRGAAVLDHDRAAEELADVGKRLQQRRDLRMRTHVGHVEYSELSDT